MKRRLNSDTNIYRIGSRESRTRRFSSLICAGESGSMSSSSAGRFECRWPVKDLTGDEGRSFLPFRDDFELGMVSKCCVSLTKSCCAASAQMKRVRERTPPKLPALVSTNAVVGQLSLRVPLPLSRRRQASFGNCHASLLHDWFNTIDPELSVALQKLRFFSSSIKRPKVSCTGSCGIIAALNSSRVSNLPMQNKSFA